MSLLCTNRFSPNRGGNQPDLRRQGETRPRRGRPLHAMALAVLAVTLVTSPSSGEEPELLTDSSLSSAISVRTDLYCSESRLRSPEVAVSWSVDRDAAAKGLAPKSFADADTVRVDLTSAPGGLDSGRFTSVAVSASDRASANKSYAVGSDADTVRFLDLSPGVIYHVRVLVLTEAGWVPSSPTRFLTPVCAVDGLDDEGEVGS